LELAFFQKKRGKGILFPRIFDSVQPLALSYVRAFPKLNGMEGKQMSQMTVDRKSLKKVNEKASTQDYDAALALALSSQNERVREALECSYSSPQDKKI